RNPHSPSLAAALKFCLDDEAAKSLRHEAKALDRVRQQGRHPGIVELRQVYFDNDPLCLEYEFVEGGDLGSLIREVHQSRVPTAETVARWLLQLLDAVTFAHQLRPPLVHRDLKPANILAERQRDGTLRLRITDFGISEIPATREIQQLTRA